MAKVLIVDDDPGMCVTLARTLIGAGYDVSVAADGVKGLAQYRASPADVVLIDLFMPRKEGLETIVELRKEFPRAAIIAMSGHRRMELMLRAAQGLGAVSTLSKPFDPETLITLVQKLTPTENSISEPQR